MNGLIHAYKNGLRSIQRSDEATKKRWLIGITASIMLIIIGLWIMYVRGTVPTVATVQNSTEQAAVTQTKKESFVATIMQGFSAVHRELGKVAATIALRASNFVASITEGAQTTNGISFDVESHAYRPSVAPSEEITERYAE